MKKFKVMMFKEQAGTLEVSEGRWVFRYEKKYLKNESLPPLSISIPKKEDDFVSHDIPPFFDGLLPEGWLKDKGESLGIYIEKKEDAVGVYLRDAIGGVSLQREGEPDEERELRKIHHCGPDQFLTDSPEDLTKKYVSGIEEKERINQNEKLLKFAFEGVLRLKAAKKCLVCLERIDDLSRIFYHDTCAKEVFGTGEDLIAKTSLSTFSRDAFSSLSSGAPLPGYQPKAQFVVLTESGEGAELILKSDVIVDNKHKNAPRGIPVFEHLTMRAAAAFGITTAKSAIVPFLDGSLGYATRRFDRYPGLKVHMEDLLQAKGVIQDDEGRNKFEGDIRDIDFYLRKYATRLGVGHGVILKQIALRTIFNFVIGNHDAHLKNHSIMYVAQKGKSFLVNLSPAYDLLPLNTMEMTRHRGRESALGINGKRSNITPADIIEEFKTFSAEKEAMEAFNKIISEQKTILWHLLEHLEIFGLENYGNEISNFLQKKFRFIEQKLVKPK